MIGTSKPKSFTSSQEDEDRASLVRDLVDAININPPSNFLTAEERQWVRLAILREAQSYAFRKAVIEKTITSLIWSAIVGMGLILLDFLRTHGLKI